MAVRINDFLFSKSRGNSYLTNMKRKNKTIQKLVPIFKLDIRNKNSYFLNKFLFLSKQIGNQFEFILLKPHLQIVGFHGSDNNKLFLFFKCFILKLLWILLLYFNY